MPSLVSVEETKSLLIIQWTDDDVRLQTLIAAASSAVEKYLKARLEDYVDYDKLEQSPPDYSGVDPLVRVATIILVGILYRDPDGTDTETFYAQGFLPKPVTGLLYPLRDPTLA